MTDFRVPEARKPHVLVRSFDGFGAQYNQNLYAAISRRAGVTDETRPAVEQAVADLQPHFVRVFFDGAAFTKPDLMQSFARTLVLAEQTSSTINVTFQGIGPNAFGDAMPAFAQVLHDAVTGEPSLVKMPIERLSSVTIRNEPNAPEKEKSLYQGQYETLDRELRRLGVRPPLRLLGGDLLLEHQDDWFTFMAENMNELLDAYSVHIYWSYAAPRDSTHGIERRLAGVREIVGGLPKPGRKPLYVTEYGARGFAEPGKRDAKPGLHRNGRPLSTTNVNAFQHAWFALRACSLGYHGLAKWDAYFAKYDRGTQAFSAIGPPQDGWPTTPVYHLLRLLTATVRPGSKVLAVEGADDTRIVTAFKSPDGKLTIVGLDAAGGELNGMSRTVRTYTIHDLPPSTPFQLHYWNLNGRGRNTAPSRPRSTSRGTLQVKVPLHSVFALRAV